MTNITERINLLMKIGKLWKEHPTQRLGQLLWNYGFKDDKRVFTISDKELLRNIEKQLDIRQKTRQVA